jgi:hypothetical protein
MADPVTALYIIGAVSAGSAVVKSQQQSVAAKEQIRALDLQAKQNTLAYQQKSVSNLDVTKRVLDRQIAQSTVRGIKPSLSPSFNALQRDTLNTAAKTERNSELEQNLMQQNIDIEKRNVKNTLYAQLFGNAADVGLSFARLQNKMPSYGE